MEFWVTNRLGVEMPHSSDEEHIVISIRNPSSPPANVYQNDKTRTVLHLAFHDIDRMPDEGSAAWYVLGGRGNIHLFGQEDAHDIAFTVANNDDVPLVIVNCEAGQSRSAAVAGALAKFYGGDDSVFFKPPYTPNMHVYRTLTDMLHWYAIVTGKRHHCLRQ